MTDLDETVILEALAAVQDPSQGRDIVALDMVTAIQIKGSNISFALQVPAHRGPAMEPVRRAAEQAALQIDGVTSATVMVTAHAAAPSAAAVDEAPVASREMILESKVRRFVAVASGKGGVGKSTVTVNLACALQRLLEADGKPGVGIMDCDIYGPSIPLMLGAAGRPEIENDLILPLQNFCVSTMFSISPFSAGSRGLGQFLRSVCSFIISV